MHHHLSEVGFDLAAGPVSLAYGGRVDHVPRRLAKGETLNKTHLPTNALSTFERWRSDRDPTAK